MASIIKQKDKSTNQNNDKEKSQTNIKTSDITNKHSKTRKNSKTKKTVKKKKPIDNIDIDYKKRHFKHHVVGDNWNKDDPENHRTPKISINNNERRSSKKDFKS